MGILDLFKRKQRSRTSWLDELADPNSGVHEALKKLTDVPIKEHKTKPPETGEKEPFIEYTIELKNDTFYIYKNTKEFFDGTQVATCGEYILAEGWNGNSQAIAFFTLNKLIAIRRTEDFIEGAKINPSGIAFVFTDSDKMLIMSENGVISKNFAYASADDNMRVLTDIVCAYVEDIGEFAVLKCFDFESQSVWSKKIKYSIGEDITQYSDEPALHLSGKLLEVVTPDGSVIRFSSSGEIVKE